MTVAVKDVLVPDLGGTAAVDVIEISVKPGDRVSKEQTLLVLESDKATVEVPSPFEGVVQQIVVSVGQQVKQGDKVMAMETGEGAAAAPAAAKPAPAAAEKAAPIATKPVPEKAASAPAEKPAAVDSSAPAAATSITVTIPDIGTADAVDVIEISVKEGNVLAQEQTMLVLESDKATMEVPCPQAGTVQKLLLKVGDKVTQGAPVLELLVQGAADAAVAAKPAATASVPAAEPSATATTAAPAKAAASATSVATAAVPAPASKVHAGPAVRLLARELGVDLGLVKSTGPRNRILKEDVHAFVKQRLSDKSVATAMASGSGLPPLPEIDFSQFGPVEMVELSRINKLSAANLHRAWVHIPHVTQFDEADITDLETFRKSESAALKDQDVKLTILAFMVKACAKSLLAFPRFNSSLHVGGEQLVFKKYVHIGIAVDTPNGLVVPVIRDADKKSVLDIAKDMQVLSQKARAKKLSPGDMQGATFSISSLGGIGGTAFTPIVNWPEVAILGVSKSQFKPVYNGKDFVPRLMLPLSLSYDHRVIDGAQAARFTAYLSQQLADIRRLLL